MSKWISTIAAAGATLLCLQGAAFGWAENWTNIRQAAQNVNTIQADFVQKRTLKILSHPIVSRGKLAYRRPSDLLWEYTAPARSALVIRQGNIARYLVRDGAVVVDSSGKLDAMKVVAGEINLWLGGNFSASKTFRPDLLPGQPPTVQLTPNDDSMQKIISRIVLTLGAKPGTVDKVSIEEGTEGNTLIEFTNVRINESIPDAQFAAPTP